MKRGHSQPWSLEGALLAVPVSKSPASLQLGSFYIFLVEDGVSKLLQQVSLQNRKKGYIISLEKKKNCSTPISLAV